MNYEIQYKKIIVLSIVLLVVFVLNTNFSSKPFNNRGVQTAHAFTLDDLKQKIEEKEKEIAELREQAKEYEGTIEEKREYASSLETQIKQHAREINQLQGQINIKGREIDATEFAIEKISLEIIDREKDMERKKEHMTSILLEIYKNDEETLVELMFKYNDFSNFFNQVQARESLEEKVIEELNKLKEVKIDLENKKVLLSEEERKLAIEIKTLDDQQKIIDWEKHRQDGLLRQTKQQETQYQNLLTEIEEKEKEVREEIFRLEDQLRLTLDPSTIPAPRGGLLQWPAEGILTQYYGCLTSRWARRSYPSCNNNTGGFHNGMDLAASFGTPIISAEEGTVIKVENSPYAYGLWIAVEHKNGLTTAYTHLSLQSVRVGQQVSRGEVIGYMGSTGFSTGSHTHFMVYASNTFTTKPSKLAGILPIGATVNPFDYLK